GPQGPEQGGRVEGAGPHFDVVGLPDEATLVGPETLQGDEQLLKSHGHAGPSRSANIKLIYQLSPRLSRMAPGRGFLPSCPPFVPVCLFCLSEKFLELVAQASRLCGLTRLGRESSVGRAAV